VEVQVSLREIQIFADGKLVACHALSSGRRERHLAPGHRRWPPPASAARARQERALILTMPGDQVSRRELQVYERIGVALAASRRR